MTIPFALRLHPHDPSSARSCLAASPPARHPSGCAAQCSAQRGFAWIIMVRARCVCRSLAPNHGCKWQPTLSASQVPSSPLPLPPRIMVDGACERMQQCAVRLLFPFGAPLLKSLLHRLPRRWSASALGVHVSQVRHASVTVLLWSLLALLHHSAILLR